MHKEAKWFLRDWGGLADDGARAETLVACHLLEAVDGWTDLGFGEFELRYLRDKQKREVDFLVVKNHKPWFLLEVKMSDTGLSPLLAHLQAQTRQLNKTREKTSGDGLWRALSPAGTDNVLAPSHFLRTLVLTCASGRPWGCRCATFSEIQSEEFRKIAG